MKPKQETINYKREDIDKMTDEKLLELVNYHLKQCEDQDVMRQLIDERGVYQDILDASRGKRKRDYVVNTVGDDLSESALLDKEGKLMKTIRHVQLDLLVSFHSRHHEPVKIKDTSSNKEREIIKPDFANEQIVHHAIIRVILPRLEKGMYRYTCASIPKRGISDARKHVSHIIETDIRNMKYILKIDIRHFFDSISHKVLKDKLRKIIKEKRLRELLFDIIDTTEKGLPLGFFTSQWLANFYLQDLDHYIKERILDDCGCNTKRTGRHGAVHLIRYMDDMVITGPNKRELHKIKCRLDIVLQRDYKLRLKYDWQVFRFDHIEKDGTRKGRFLDFVGYRFYCDHVIIRKRTYKKMIKLINKMIKEGKENISSHDASAMLSYYGIIYWSDAHGLYDKLLKPYVSLKDLKKIAKNENNSLKELHKRSGR